MPEINSGKYGDIRSGARPVDAALTGDDDVDVDI